MKVVSYLIFLALAAGLCWAALRYREEQALRLQNANLRQALSEVRGLREANDRLAKLSIDPEELQRLGGEQSELLRLRAQVGELRRTAGLDVPELENRVRKTLAEAETAAKQADVIQARRAAKEQSAAVQNTLNGLIWTVRQVAEPNAQPPFENGATLPTSFEQLQAKLAQLPEDLRAVHARRLSSTNQFGISAQSFEFMPQDRILTTRDGSVLLRRERTPRSLPDGGWVRAYGFVNGDVEQAFSKDGQFTKWEREHSAGRNPPEHSAEGATFER